MNKNKRNIHNKKGDFMNIDSIMSKDLIIGNIHDKVEDIATLMKKHDIGFLPLALKNKILGVITDRDLVVGSFANHFDKESPVEQYMTKEIISIDLYQTIEEAMNLMGKHKVKRLLVTNRKKVVGILSLSDIIHSDIDPSIIMKNLKQIWEIYRNIDRMDAEIDEFYL